MKYSLYIFLTILVSFSLGYLTAYHTGMTVADRVIEQAVMRVDAGIARRFEMLREDLETRQPIPKTAEQLTDQDKEFGEWLREYLGED